MSLIGRAFPAVEQRIMSLSELDALMDRVYYGLPTTSGQYVNVDTALQCNAVWACVQAVSKAISSLPFNVYQHQGGGKVKRVDHPIWSLIHDAPNEEMTALEFWETLLTHRLTWGNGYAQIVFNDHGPMELWPLDPSRVTPRRDPDTNELYYLYRRKPNDNKVIPFREMFHLKGRSLDGVTGLSPIAYERQTIGLALAAEEYGARYFGNGANPGGTINVKGKLSVEAAKRLKADWEKAHTTASNAHRVAVLEEGVTFTPTIIPAEDTQFLATKAATKEDIAAIFGVPPHKIGLLEHTNRASIEEQNIEWVVDTVLPECVRIEQAIQRDLIAVSDGRRGVFAEVDIAGILRGNQAARYAAYVQGRQWGWLSANDVRASEGMNPLPGAEGDIYMVPLNMIPASSVGQSSAPQSEPTSNEPPDAPPGGTPNPEQTPPPTGVGGPIQTLNPQGKASQSTENWRRLVASVLIDDGALVGARATNGHQNGVDGHRAGER